MIARRAFMNRASDRRAGRCVMVPVRYADDYIILVSAGDGDADTPRSIAEQEKSSLTQMLQNQMGLTLSPEKTLVTPVTETMRFLGHHMRVRQDTLRRQLRPRLVIPKDRSQRLRRTIELIFDRSISTETLEQPLKHLNPLLRGWGNIYRHAWGAKRVFAALDHYVWMLSPTNSVPSGAKANTPAYRGESPSVFPSACAQRDKVSAATPSPAAIYRCGAESALMILFPSRR